MIASNILLFPIYIYIYVVASNILLLPIYIVASYIFIVSLIDFTVLSHLTKHVTVLDVY